MNETKERIQGTPDEFEEIWKQIHERSVKDIEKTHGKLPKPCHILQGLCPYGYFVEFFPLRKQKSEISCEIFGHDCPIYHFGEYVAITPPAISNNIFSKERFEKEAKKLSEILKESLNEFMKESMDLSLKEAIKERKSMEKELRNKNE